jgi:hypothetical protein
MKANAKALLRFSNIELRFGANRLLKDTQTKY